MGAKNQMTQEERRNELLELCGRLHLPDWIALKWRFRVTRQIIVGDVAVLRARGEQIIATPQGYLLYRPQLNAVHRSTIAVRHASDQGTIAQELNLIVDLGATVLDVTVEHPLYGELTANLQVSSRAEVRQFVKKMEELHAEPLLVLTDGYHLHTVEAPTSEVMEAVRDALRQAGFLAE